MACVRLPLVAAVVLLAVLLPLQVAAHDKCRDTHDVQCPECLMDETLNCFWTGDVCTSYRPPKDVPFLESGHSDECESWIPPLRSWIPPTLEDKQLVSCLTKAKFLRAAADGFHAIIDPISVKTELLEERHVEGGSYRLLHFSFGMLSGLGKMSSGLTLWRLFEATRRQASKILKSEISLLKDTVGDRSTLPKTLAGLDPHLLPMGPVIAFSLPEEDKESPPSPLLSSHMVLLLAPGVIPDLEVSLGGNWKTPLEKVSGGMDFVKKLVEDYGKKLQSGSNPETTDGSSVNLEEDRHLTFKYELSGGEKVLCALVYVEHELKNVHVYLTDECLRRLVNTISCSSALRI